MINELRYSQLNKINCLCFTVVVIFALISTAKMASFCLSGGILNPDVSLYLISALKYSGLDVYNICNPEDLFFTPVISFLTSLLFRVELVDKAAIIIVTGIFGFLSYIGLYFLLKLRFNSLLSLLGVIIYGSTSVVIFNLAKGLIDLPALSISIWALYFAILAIDKNPKYYLICFPLLVIGFFTKYVVGFMLPLIFLYYVMNKDIIGLFDCLISDRILFKEKMREYFFSKEFKYILVSIFISLIFVILICKTLILDFGGSLTFLEQSVNTFNGNNRVSTTRIFNPDKSVYIDNFSYFLYEKQELLPLLSNLLYIILGAGIIIKLISLLKNFELLKSKKKSFKTKDLKEISYALIILLVIGMFIGFKYLENNMFSNLCMLIGITLLYSILNKYDVDNKKLSLNLLFIAFFLIYLIFLSLYPDKTFRYALPLLIPFIYFVIWGLSCLFNLISGNIDSSTDKINVNINYSKLSNYVAVILIIILFVTTLSFITPMEFERSNDIYQEVLYCGFSNDLDDACDFIKSTDSNFHSKTFASFVHSSRIIRWNMNVNVTVLDTDNPDLSFNETDYLILFKDLDFENYNKIKDCGDFHIYSHK